MCNGFVIDVPCFFVVDMHQLLYLMFSGFRGRCVMVLLLMYNGFIVVDMQKFLYLMFDGFGS